MSEAGSFTGEVPARIVDSWQDNFTPMQINLRITDAPEERLLTVFFPLGVDRERDGDNHQLRASGVLVEKASVDMFEDLGLKVPLDRMGVTVEMVAPVPGVGVVKNGGMVLAHMEAPEAIE